MIKFYKSIVFFITALCLSASFVTAQTTVYTNDFSGIGGVSPFPGGTPPLVFGQTSFSTDATLGSAAGVQIGGPVGSALLTDNQLALWTTVAPVPGTTNNGYAYVTAPLAGFSAPFNPTLTANTELITWTFNIRSSQVASGFALGQDEAAVVLAASNTDLRSLGNGYAIIYNPAAPLGLQFVRYTGGLSGTVTPLISSAPAFASPDNYLSVKIIYEPTIDQWTMYIRDDGPAAFADPAVGVTLAMGSATDATYTGTAMVAFGMYSNYSLTAVIAGPDAQYAYFDNFTVSMSCPEIEGGLSTCVGLTTTLTHPTPGGTWNSDSPAIATVDGSTGIVTGVSAGTATITYTVGTCEVVAVVTVNPLPAPPAIGGTLSVCSGATTTLSIPGPPLGGTWSSGNTSIATVVGGTGVVTGVTGGTAYISYTIPTGCFSTAILTVNPIASIVGYPVFCEGDTRLFNDAVPGGAWSSTDATVASIDAAGEVTALSVGTATISYVLPSTCYATTTVTVNANPTPIAGIPVVCEGLTSPLTSSPPGGFWSSSNETVASVSGTGLLIGNVAGTAIITYKLESGCQVTLDITVNATPSGVGGVLTVCQGSTTELSNVLAGGTWSSSNTAVGTIDVSTGILTGITAGTTNITYMMPTGCFRYGTATVNATPAAITGVQSVCVGLTTSLTSSAGGVWTSANTAIATVLPGAPAGTGVVTGVTANTVVISYAFATGCFRSVVVTVTPLPPAITGTATVCTGRTTTLANTSAGGTWGSGDIAVATVGAASGIVSGLTVGTSTIVYTIGTGCSTSRIVTVIASPAATTGVPIVCVGGTTPFSNATPGGNWTSSNTGVATVDIATGVVSGVTAGSSNITYTTANGCFAILTATVNPIPNAITGTRTVCVGATTLLSSTSSGGTWSSGNVGVATVSGFGTVTGVSGGTAEITYTRLTCITTAIVTVNALPSAIGGPNAVCIGSSITATDFTAGGTWSSSNTGVATIGAGTGIVSTVTIGTTTITYQLTTTGCYRTRTVSVNPLPAAISGSTVLCPATSVTLSNTSPGGTWSSANTAIATIVTGTGVMSGVATGTTNITYTLATGCIRTTVVTVSSAPPAIITPIGDTTLCPGDFVTLTGSTSPGVTYEWLLGGVVIPTATSPTYVASTTGSYQIRVNVAVGCSSISTPMAVTVVPATATITVPSGTTTTCAGTPLVLDANVGVGLTYQWSLAGAPIAGATGSSYNALASGAYTVRVTNSAGCWAVSSPTSITVNPAPSNVVTVSGSLTICSNNTVTFTAATGTGYTYQWYNSGGAIAGATSVSYVTNTAESYYAVVSDGSGCTSTTATSIVVVNPVPDVTITPGGPRLFCVGGSVTLDAVAGYNYQWYRGGVAIPGAISANYTATLAGGYRVRVTDAVTGCTEITGADTVVTTVGLVNVVALTPAKFCWGGSSLLSTNASYLGGAISYQWYFNGVVVPGATAPNYLATVAGNYSCSISVPSSCTSMTANMAVIEVPLPDPPITYAAGLFHTGNYFVTYQWYKNLIPISGATSSSTPATGNGNYKVAVTDTNGCQSVSAVYVLTGWTPPPPPPSGVEDVNNTDISIYPNPATEVVFIASSMNVRAVISGVDGKTLIDKANAKEVSLKGLANGLYMIALFDNDGQQLKVQKLIKR